MSINVTHNSQYAVRGNVRRFYCLHSENKRRCSFIHKNKASSEVPKNLHSIWWPPDGDNCGCKSTSGPKASYGKMALRLSLSTQFPAFVNLGHTTFQQSQWCSLANWQVFSQWASDFRMRPTPPCHIQFFVTRWLQNRWRQRSDVHPLYRVFSQLWCVSTNSLGSEIFPPSCIWVKRPALPDLCVQHEQDIRWFDKLAYKQGQGSKFQIFVSYLLQQHFFM